MTNDPGYNRFHELSWRQKLKPEEAAELRAWLSAHPEAQADGQEEGALNEALAQVPDAPVASNFTARVLQALARETAARSRRSAGWRVFDWRPRWARGVGLAAVMVVTAVVSYNHFEGVQRVRMAKSLVPISEVASLPNPKVLEDFDAIRALDQTSADVELLALYK